MKTTLKVFTPLLIEGIENQLQQHSHALLPTFRGTLPPSTEFAPDFFFPTDSYAGICTDESAHVEVHNKTRERASLLEKGLRETPDAAKLTEYIVAVAYWYPEETLLATRHLLTRRAQNGEPLWWLNKNFRTKGLIQLARLAAYTGLEIEDPKPGVHESLHEALYFVGGKERELHYALHDNSHNYDVCNDMLRRFQNNAIPPALFKL